MNRSTLLNSSPHLALRNVGDLSPKQKDTNTMKNQAIEPNRPTHQIIRDMTADNHCKEIICSKQTGHRNRCPSNYYNRPCSRYYINICNCMVKEPTVTTVTNTCKGSE